MTFQKEGGGDGNIFPYGMAFTSGELDSAMLSFSDAMEPLLRLAESEKTAQLLAQEIERTRRRVNALENVMIPNYQETIKYITMKLEENERANTTRLMKVKDMVAKKASKQKESRRQQPSENKKKRHPKILGCLFCMRICTLFSFLHKLAEGKGAWQDENESLHDCAAGGESTGAVLGRHSGCGRGNRHCGYGFYGQNKGDCTAIHG